MLISNCHSYYENHYEMKLRIPSNYVTIFKFGELWLKITQRSWYKI